MFNKNIGINHSVEDSIAYLYHKLFDKTPSLFETIYKPSLYEDVKKDLLQICAIYNISTYTTETFVNNASDSTNNNTVVDTYINKKAKIIIRQSSSSLRVMYDLSHSLSNEIVGHVKKINCIPTKIDIATPKIFVLQETHGSYTLRKLSDFPKEKMYFEAYKENFKEAHELIFEKLQNTSTGLVLLHGVTGSGKTTYIKYLTSVINRKFIIVPSRIVNDLDSPAMVQLLIDNPKSILILEDEENSLSDRKGLSFSHVNTLLNLSDGLLGQTLKCTVICTFNTELSNIDPALLRKGRLIAQYKFEKLSSVEAEKLASKLGRKLRFTESISAVDVFKYDEKELKVNKISSSIGFNKNT